MPACLTIAAYLSPVTPHSPPVAQGSVLMYNLLPYTPILVWGLGFWFGMLEHVPSAITLQSLRHCVVITLSPNTGR